MGLLPVPWSERRLVSTIKKELGLGSPRRARIAAVGPTGQCYKNCDLFVSRHGGSVRYGWLAIGIPNKFIVLEHHAIVLADSGEYIDATEFAGAPIQETVIFIDNSTTPCRDYPPFIANKFLAFTGHGNAMEAYRRADEYKLSILRRLVDEAKRQGVPWVSGKGVSGLRVNAEVSEIQEGLRKSEEMMKEAQDYW